jgi:hypothetical protein
MRALDVIVWDVVVTIGPERWVHFTPRDRVVEKVEMRNAAIVGHGDLAIGSSAFSTPAYTQAQTVREHVQAGGVS